MGRSAERSRNTHDTQEVNVSPRQRATEAVAHVRTKGDVQLLLCLFPILH